MAKDYHKGKKIACYIPDELAELLELYRELYKTSKTQIITDALYAYIGPCSRQTNDINS